MGLCSLPMPPSETLISTTAEQEITLLWIIREFLLRLEVSGHSVTVSCSIHL